jgi:hypothetical protein
MAVLAGCGQRPFPSIHLGHPNLFASERSPGSVRVAPDVLVRSAEFGRLDTDDDGEEVFTAVTELPPDSGQVFGWVVRVDTSRRSLRWQERLTFPSPPAAWGDAATDRDIVISRDGRTASARGEEEVEEGEVSRFYWSLEDGDPPGDYRLDLAIEGKPVAHFVFRVPATVHQKPMLVRRDAARRAVPTPAYF